MSESWQDWDSKDYLMFLKEFYGEQLTLARALVDVFMSKRAWPKEEVFKYSREFTVAVFGKIAPPAVYLKAEYDKWKAKQNDELPEGEYQRQPTNPITTPPKARTEDNWKPTKTEGTLMCSERYVTDEELAKAKNTSDGTMWYSPPRDGYRWGLVFRKVKP